MPLGYGEQPVFGKTTSDFSASQYQNRFGSSNIVSPNVLKPHPSAVSSFQKAIEQFKPEGELVKATKTQLNALKKKYMAGVESDLARRGLSASTLGAGAETTFAKDIAAPTLASGEASRVGNLAQLYQALAGMQQGAYQSGTNLQLGAFEGSENRQIGAAQFNVGAGQRGQELDLERLRLALSGQQRPTQTMQPDVYGTIHNVSPISF